MILTITSPRLNETKQWFKKRKVCISERNCSVLWYHPGVLMGTGKFNAGGGNPAMDYHPIQGGVEMLSVASCYRNQDKLRPDEPVGSYTDFTYLIPCNEWSIFKYFVFNCRINCSWSCLCYLVCLLFAVCRLKYTIITLQMCKPLKDTN